MTTILAASAVIRDTSGRLLMVLRDQPPQSGLWSLPGGKAEEAETLEDTARREVAEETGLNIRVERLLGTTEICSADHQHYTIHCFAGSVLGGTEQAGDDAADLAWFSIDELRELPVTANLYEDLRRFGVVKELF